MEFPFESSKELLENPRSSWGLPEDVLFVLQHAASSEDDWSSFIKTISPPHRMWLQKITWSEKCKKSCTPFVTLELDASLLPSLNEEIQNRVEETQNTFEEDFEEQNAQDSKKDDDESRRQTRSMRLRSSSGSAADIPVQEETREASGSELREGLEKALHTLTDRKDISRAFLRQVRRSEAKKYRQMIKNPMNLAMMQVKLDGSEYTTVGQFHADLDLMIENYQKFYGKSGKHENVVLAFRELCEEVMQEILACCEEDTSSKERMGASLALLRECERFSGPLLLQEKCEHDYSHVDQSILPVDWDETTVQQHREALIQRAVSWSVDFDKQYALQPCVLDEKRQGGHISQTRVPEIIDSAIVLPCILDGNGEDGSESILHAENDEDGDGDVKEANMDGKETVIYDPLAQNHDIRRSLSILDRVKGLRAKIQSERGHVVEKRERKKSSSHTIAGCEHRPTVGEIDDVSTGQDFLKSFVSIILRQHGMDDAPESVLSILCDVLHSYLERIGKAEQDYRASVAESEWTDLHFANCLFFLTGENSYTLLDYLRDGVKGYRKHLLETEVRLLEKEKRIINLSKKVPDLSEMDVALLTLFHQDFNVDYLGLPENVLTRAQDEYGFDFRFWQFKVSPQDSLHVFMLLLLFFPVYL
eukprot:TRINITY_DN26_c1_g1_i3.p1 TRINITY_DN26_c1_g1~~TRINITY_DN26_c1_g1_i3.p1  ORF type:complete len:647 (-),score=156.76 TRINITY_DN26_c1_g1_i3:173-2113(-)